jgi:hypothetical protein
MSDTTVFVFGMFIFVLLFGGLTLTVMEMKRIGRVTDSKRPRNKPLTPVSMMDRQQS